MLLKKIRNSPLALTITSTFNVREEKGFGRTLILTSSLLTSVFSNLALGGALYTAFLAANDFSIVDTGYLTVISTLASLLMVLISPVLMNKIMSRGKGIKLFLCGMRFLSYTMSIIGVTLITLYIPDKDTKYLLFSVISFTTTLINTLLAPGFTSWQTNFIADEQSRTRYISIQSIAASFVSHSSSVLA